MGGDDRSQVGDELLPMSLHVSVHWRKLMTVDMEDSSRESRRPDHAKTTMPLPAGGAGRSTVPLDSAAFLALDAQSTRIDPIDSPTPNFSRGEARILQFSRFGYDESRRRVCENGI
jgi:hypothetical protein